VSLYASCRSLTKVFDEISILIGRRADMSRLKLGLSDSSEPVAESKLTVGKFVVAMAVVAVVVIWYVFYSGSHANPLG
jgi:hypothetical protein